MPTSTPRLQLRKPDDPDNVNVDLDLAANFDKIDEAVGVTVCTSTTRPTTNLWTGRLIFETDSLKVLEYNGSGWTDFSIARGWIGETESNSLSPALANGEFSDPYVKHTFTAVAKRRCLIKLAGGFYGDTADKDFVLKLRWAAGTTVIKTDTQVGSDKTFEANAANGIASFGWEYNIAPSTFPSGNVTVGLFYSTSTEAGGNIFVPYGKISVFDTGA